MEVSSIELAIDLFRDPHELSFAVSDCLGNR